MESHYVKKIQRGLKNQGFVVHKQSPGGFSYQNGMPDLIAEQGDLKFAFEIKDFKQPSLLKRNQIYQLNQYRKNGYRVAVIKNEAQGNLIQTQIQKLQANTNYDVRTSEEKSCQNNDDLKS